MLNVEWNTSMELNIIMCYVHRLQFAMFRFDCLHGLDFVSSTSTIIWDVALFPIT